MRESLTFTNVPDSFNNVPNRRLSPLSEPAGRLAELFFKAGGEKIGVIKTDLEGDFRAFCLEGGEMMLFHGWAIYVTAA